MPCTIVPYPPFSWMGQWLKQQLPRFKSWFYYLWAVQPLGMLFKPVEPISSSVKWV